MSSIVFSSDLRRVEGDVRVVPSEAWRPWLRRHGPPPGEMGDEVADVVLAVSGALVGDAG
jgi:hypothetical protein